MMLFPCKSDKMIKEFAETANNNYTPDQFLKLFQYATKDNPYDFLYIDCREPKGFRKNFNEKLDVKEEETPGEEVQCSKAGAALRACPVKDPVRL